MTTTVTHKLSNEVGLKSERGFPPVSGVHYLTRLGELHLRLRPKTYFEIGTESGASLAFAKCTSIAVDPRFRLEGNVAAGKPSLHLYQGASDDFFASGLLGKLGLSIDFAFLDGMHLFEYLLRDFINTERHMEADGLIVMHDCIPFNHAMAKRSWDRRETVHWTGDVWKLIPILRKYRPDLKVVVRDYAPTGLVEVSGLDPQSTILAEKYDEILANYLDLSLDDYGLAAFCELADPQSVRTPFVRKSPVAASRQIAIKTCVPSLADTEKWGDFHFANGLAAAFRRLNIGARVDTMESWSGQSEDSLDLVLQGHDHYPAGPDRACINWFIYPGKRFPHDALANYDHVFCSGEAFIDKISQRAPGAKVTFLPQAFDADVMTATETPERDSAVFVGNNHFRGDRAIIGHACAADEKIRIWGNGWDQTEASRFLVQPQLPNGKLPQVYGNASAVLCDHLPQMARNGFVSNRIYDALACAAPVISDPVSGLPTDFRDLVYIVSTPQEFAEALNAARGETKEFRARRLEYSLEMRSLHSFDQRAQKIVEYAEEKGLL